MAATFFTTRPPLSNNPDASKFGIRYHSHGSNVIEGEQFPIQFFRVGFYPEYSFEDLVASAVDVASAADVAVLFARTNEDRAGLSYTTFKLSNLQVTPSGDFASAMCERRAKSLALKLSRFMWSLP